MTARKSTGAIAGRLGLIAIILAVAGIYLIATRDSGSPAVRGLADRNVGDEPQVQDLASDGLAEPPQQPDLEIPPRLEQRESEPLEETALCSLMVLDVSSIPIEGASVLLDGSDEIHKTDEHGLVAIAAFRTRALVLADGFDAKTCEIWPGRQTVVLNHHPGVEILVVWDRSNEPVANASIRASGIWKEWKQEALGRANRGRLITNESGVVVVPNLLVDGEYVVLEVRHPSGAAALQELWGLELDGMQRSRVTIRLPDHADQFRVNLSDPDGLPYEGAKVTIRLWRGEYSQRTNADGDADIPLTVGFESSDDLLGVAYEVTLPDGQKRWIEETWEEFDETGRRLLVVDHQPVHGRVLGDQPQSFVVATAAACIPGNPGADFGARPNERDRLQWFGVDQGGRFEIPAGWQGRRSCVVIKHAQSGVIVGSVLVGEEHGPVEFTAPPTCKIECQVAPSDAAGDLRIELRPADRWAAASEPSGRGTIEFEIAGGDQILEAPRSTYIASLRKGEMKWTVGTIDATGDDCRLDVEIPSQRFLAGNIQGTKSGPLANLRLVITDQEKRILASTRTNGSGDFQAHYLGNGPATVHFQWPREVFELWRQALDPIAITDREARIDVVRPEAIMQLVEPPTSPLAGLERIVIEFLGSEGDQVLWTQDRELGTPGHLDLTVPPGTYMIRKNVRSSLAYELTVRLGVGDQRVVVCDAEDASVLRLEVAAPRTEKEQWAVVRVRGPDGEVIEDRASLVDREPDPLLNLLVLGGEYEIEVECVGRDPHGDEYSIGTWTGKAAIAPGQSVSVRAIIQ